MTTSITHRLGSEILAQIGYPERDDVGNPLKIADWVGGWNFGYDFNNRLISAKVPDLGVAGKPAYPVPEQPAGGDYGYDWVGNRLNPPTGVNAMVYDAADRLTLWPGMYSYTYFGDGSMKEVKNPAGTQVLRSYTYNDDGLLSGATYAGRSSTFTWDADRNRVGMTMNGDDYSFVYDTTAGIPAVIEEVQPGGSVFYIREPGGELIARVDGSDIRYYHFDELGSTRMLTDGSGTVTDRYVYDAWGNTLSHTGGTEQPYQYVGRLGYYTHHQDPEFHLMQLGVRFYDAQVGRFTQRDPLPRIGVSDYAYCYDMPLQLRDPSGMTPSLWEMEKQMIGCMSKCIGTGLGLNLIQHMVTSAINACTYRGGGGPAKFIGMAQCLKAIQRLSKWGIGRIWRSPTCSIAALIWVDVVSIYCAQDCIRSLGKEWGVW